MPRKQTRAIDEPSEVQTLSEEMDNIQAAAAGEGENLSQTDSENAKSQRIHDEDCTNADESETISQTDSENCDNSPQNAVPGFAGIKNSVAPQTDSESNADFKDPDQGSMSSQEETVNIKTEKKDEAEISEGEPILSDSLLCPRCQTGLNALLLDLPEPMCPYIGCHNGYSCSRFREIIPKPVNNGRK